MLSFRLADPPQSGENFNRPALDSRVRGSDKGARRRRSSDAQVRPRNLHQPAQPAQSGTELAARCGRPCATGAPLGGCEAGTQVAGLGGDAGEQRRRSPRPGRRRARGCRRGRRPGGRRGSRRGCARRSSARRRAQRRRRARRAGRRSRRSRRPSGSQRAQRAAEAALGEAGREQQHAQAGAAQEELERLT